MRKALHDNKEAFLTFRDGKIHIWDSRDVDVFIEAANKGLELVNKMQNAYREIDVIDSTSEIAQEIPEVFRKVRFLEGVPKVSQEDLFCLAVNDWMHEYLEQGRATEEVVDELNKFISTIRYRHVLMPPKDGEPYWEYIADLDRHLDPSESAAFGFSQMLTMGGLKLLKRCKNPGCGHYFLGRSNAKWCSKSCGSLCRVKKMRKRNSE